MYAIRSYYAQDVPVSELTKDQMDKLLYGTGDIKVRFRYENDFGMSKDAMVTFEGIIPNLERRYRDTASEGIRDVITSYSIHYTKLYDMRHAGDVIN